MKNSEKIETLIQLGLTLNQARAYLTLVENGPAGAKKLSENSKITRPDIYRVMPTLEQTGLIEKIINNPTTYKAIPIQQATRILLQRKNKENTQLQRKTKSLINELKISRTEQAIEDQDSQVIMISRKEAIIQKLAEALSNTKETLEVITSSQRFLPAILNIQRRIPKSTRKRGKNPNSNRKTTPRKDNG